MPNWCLALCYTELRRVVMQWRVKQQLPFAFTTIIPVTTTCKLTEGWMFSRSDLVESVAYVTDIAPISSTIVARCIRNPYWIVLGVLTYRLTYSTGIQYPNNTPTALQHNSTWYNHTVLHRILHQSTVLCAPLLHVCALCPVKHTPSPYAWVLFLWTCFLVCDLRRVTASSAARSSSISFSASASLCATLTTPSATWS